MSDPTNPSNESNGSHADHGPSERARRFFDDLSSSIRKGAEDARKVAEDAIPKVKTAAKDAAYWTAYGVSFAAMFEWTLLKHFTPECVKAGCRDGVRSGQQRADAWVNEMRQRQQSSPTTPPPVQPSPNTEVA